MGNKVTEVLQHSQYYVHFSVLIVAHAEDQFVEKEELDKATEGYLVQNVKDIKQAQVRLTEGCVKKILPRIENQLIARLEKLS